MKMLYDGFFKEVMNPEYAPRRLGDFLSEVLGAAVRVKNVLPNDTTRLTDESFPACLGHRRRVRGWPHRQCGSPEDWLSVLRRAERLVISADLLLRQYKRLRDERKKQFSYRDIHTVYTIASF